MRPLLHYVFGSDEPMSARIERAARLIRAMTETVTAEKLKRDIEVIVKFKVKPRSLQANGYLWGVCYALIEDETGYEKEELHELMCKMYFGVKHDTMLGGAVERPIRTTTTDENGEPDTLDPEGFGKFIEFVIRRAAQYAEVIIPPPTARELGL